MSFLHEKPLSTVDDEEDIEKSAESLSFDDDSSQSSTMPSGDRVLIWPEDDEQEEAGRQEAGPQIERWLDQVTEATNNKPSGVVHEERETEEDRSLLQAVEWQLSYLRMQPTRCLKWIEEGASINRKVLGDFRGENCRPDFKLDSNVDTVQFILLNDRARIASWAIGSRSVNTSESTRQDAEARYTEYEKSALEMKAEMFPTLDPDGSLESRPTRSLLISREFNRGVLEVLTDDGLTAVPDGVWSDVRAHNAVIKDTYDRGGWSEFSPEFQTLFASWSDSMEALRDAVMTDLPPPPL
ncbi:hypothetical protein L202_02583 [Cryptococcus amylolentus CBS 6039]|uniref:Uncharacterized protein n=1 Tax=Cryptococcus amylolentus CBS 6039 TaxID=1295533 RepID=A0A1E3I1R7_9TREE|nr:hypothetical protein L202_02583 [Cryptococcus amylolentus CBS 6039]ODN82305.1 hypothetical protein L202_02583 [Cryptococcus amylolentus CBS 6039]